MEDDHSVESVLLAVMTALILWVGQLMGGRQGMIIALIFAAGMNFFSYWYSDKLVLKMYRASELNPGQAPEFYATVHMFIVNPLSGRSLMSLFSTHPPLEERIARLRGAPPSSKGKVEPAGDKRTTNAKAAWDRLSDDR